MYNITTPSNYLVAVYFVGAEPDTRNLCKVAQKETTPKTEIPANDSTEVNSQTEKLDGDSIPKSLKYPLYNH